MLFASRLSSNPLGQPLADFIGRDGSASFRVLNAFIDGGERFLVFVIKDGSRILEFELLRFRHRGIVGRSGRQRNGICSTSCGDPSFRKGAEKWGARPSMGGNGISYDGSFA